MSTSMSIKAFTFGKNWKSYSQTVNDNHLRNVTNSLKKNLEVTSLKGKSFLDMGSGSGVFSLAAHSLGADVTSIDYDMDSVECTANVKEKFASNNLNNTWSVAQGSVLDSQLIKELGVFDIVYSWGVLHHTGNMMLAFENIDKNVKAGGKLFISIYNDQGRRSKIWHWIKKTYNKNALGKFLMKLICIPYFFLSHIFLSLKNGKNPYTEYKAYYKNRGMNMYYDWIDWIGGYPFEVAKPEEIFEFFKQKGYRLEKMKLTAGLGCNELIFTKNEK